MVLVSGPMVMERPTAASERRTTSRTMRCRGTLALAALPLLLLVQRPRSADSFLSANEAARTKGPNESRSRLPASTSASDSAAPAAVARDEGEEPSKPPTEPPLPVLLNSYAMRWESLLGREHREAAEELRLRRKSYSRSQLEAGGLAVFDAVATPETEVHGEKVVRVAVFDGGGGGGGGDGGRRGGLRDKFKRGDVLVLTPQVAFRGKDVPPREGLVMDVGEDHICLGVGSSWPAGVMEMRKHDSYHVRLDRSSSSAPLRAQQKALERLRKGRAGDAATLLVRMYYGGRTLSENARSPPAHFEGWDDLDGRIEGAVEEAASIASFEPNGSQRQAIAWALKRKIGLIRGPPGTGKTRCSALLIAAALNMDLKQPHGEDDEGQSHARHAPRILAVTHSNGAADVLLQALLQLNVPAVRAGRPASVSPSVQHRTIAALSEQMPEVVMLRQQAGDASLDQHTRQSAAFDSTRYMNDAQTTIARTAPVVVASCIGAQQLSSILGQDEDGQEPIFPIVVLDEAAQTTEPALLCALAAARASQVILVGDTRQLPPTIATRDVDLQKTLGISPMERLLKNGVDEFVLKEQYRMPSALLQHPNHYFYNGVVECAAKGGAGTLHSPPSGFPWPGQGREPLAFLEVGKNSEVVHSFGGRSNPREAEVVIDIVEKVIAAGDVLAENIAIITPYSKQVQLFRTHLSDGSRNGSKLTEVKVGTVDSFQGQETDLAIFSSVRSNLLKELGFLRDARRLNVAITRARRGLIVVGDPTVLRTCRHWAAFLDSCTDRSCTLTLDGYYSSNEVTKTTDLSCADDVSLAFVEMNNAGDAFCGLFPTP